MDLPWYRWIEFLVMVLISTNSKNEFKNNRQLPNPVVFNTGRKELTETSHVGTTTVADKREMNIAERQVETKRITHGVQ